MKKIILPIFLLLLSSVGQADSIKMSTILKPPVNTINRLQLIRQPSFDTSNCIDGTVFLNNNRNLVVCKNHILKTMDSPWKQNGGSNFVYLQDWANQNVKVGIGTTTPNQKLDISKTSASGVNSIQINTLDIDQNLGMNIITRGVPTAASNNSAAFINFLANGDAGQIAYLDRRNWAPSAPSGLGIASVLNDRWDIWMDAVNGNVGIYVDPNFNGSPAAQLEVNNGNLKTNTVYLTAPNGTNTAELKANYTPGGYYAVLAP